MADPFLRGGYWGTPNGSSRYFKRQLEKLQWEGTLMQRADFRQFYREAHNVTCLTDREKMLLGLAVAMTRNCEP